MSNFQDNQFFVDVKNSNQYAVSFQSGQISDVTTVNGVSNKIIPIDAMLKDEIVMVDDETNELYRMRILPAPDGRFTIELQGIPDDIEPELNKAMDSLPTHHSRGADKVRIFIDDQNRRVAQMSDMRKGFLSSSIKGSDGMEGRQEENDDNWNPTQDRTPVKTILPPEKLKPGMKGEPSGGYKVTEKSLKEELQKFGKDITEAAKRGELDPIIGRDKELDQLKQFLLRKNKASVNLIGEAGTGKTAMFDALAQDIISGKAEEELSDARVIALDVTGMGSTEEAKFTGQAIKPLKKILDGLEERGGYINGQKIILCLDEIHSILGMGASSGNGQGGAGQVMKPFLARGSVTCVGTTTLKEHKKHIESDAALNRRFQPLIIEPTDEKTTLVILKKLSSHYGKYHGIKKEVSEENLKKIVKLTNRFMPLQFQPDKSVGVLDDAMAIARKNQREEVLDSDVITSISKASKMKEEFLNQKDHERFVKLSENMLKDVLGQDEQLEAITQRLVAARAGLTDPNQPWGAFILAGPTGVGKTETARVLAKHLHGSEGDMIKIDMNNYMDKHAVSKLIGAPAGFVGHDDTEPELEKIRKKPYSVVVFDEIEKAHPDVFNILLPILEDGEVEDQKGNMISFKNTVIIMTTNLGAGLANQEPVIPTGYIEDRDSVYESAVKNHFKPELIGRLEGLGGILVYNRLSDDVLGKVLEREVDKVSERLLDNSGGGLQLKNVEMILTDDVRKELIEKAQKIDEGARSVKGLVSKELSQPLGGWLMSSKVKYTEGKSSKDKSLRALFEAESKAHIVINEVGKGMNPVVEIIELSKPKKDKKEEPIKMPAVLEKKEDSVLSSNDNKSPKHASKILKLDKGNKNQKFASQGKYRGPKR